jgi:hypothetical protein
MIFFNRWIIIENFFILSTIYSMRPIDDFVLRYFIYMKEELDKLTGGFYTNLRYENGKRKASV